MYFALEPIVKDPLFRVSQILGHEELSTTALYIGLKESDAEETMNAYYNYMKNGGHQK